MIRGYTDFAANERTFLAWVRTGIAVIALGFVVERFNLFLMALADGSMTPNAAQMLRLASPTGRYGGMGLVGAGVAMIAIATLRFFFVMRLLAADSPMLGRLADMALGALAGLILGVAGFSAYLGFG